MRLDLAEARALRLIAKHCPHVAFKWSRKTSLCGEYVDETETVYLSKPITAKASWYETRSTILHEIAHALTADEDKAHGPKWRRTCKRLGIAREVNYVAAHEVRRARALLPPCPSPRDIKRMIKILTDLVVYGS